MIALGSLPTHDLSSESKITQVIMKGRCGHRDVMVKGKPLPDFVEIELRGFVD
jgi:hypothetical protein